MRQPPQLLILALLVLSLSGIFVYTAIKSPPSNRPFYYRFCPEPIPSYLSASSKVETVCQPAARYLDPNDLIYGTVNRSMDGGKAGEYRENSEGGVPKLIHQSWMDMELPVKFSKWSDSLRVRHPDWSWVLWTDEDNAHLISERHPHLNETYWALKNAIQRADFVRNIYMWEFGGVYADLDMECLRPLDSLLTPPFDKSTLSPHYPLSSSLPTSLPTSHALAFAGSMEALPIDQRHSIPNAFMASTPHHPFWLLPLSRVLKHMHADAEGHGAETDEKVEAESMTGPEALLRSVEAYRDHREIGGSLESHKNKEGTLIVHPILSHLVGQSAKVHDVVIFDTGVIYPFSWSTTVKTDNIHQSCRAAPGFPFDPVKCQDACRAYERGARLITYWSHTWSQSGDVKDLEVVGS